MKLYYRLFAYQLLLGTRYICINIITEDDIDNQKVCAMSAWKNLVNENLTAKYFNL